MRRAGRPGAQPRRAGPDRDEQDAESLRTIWPFAVGHHETTRHIVGWCELRSFRTDRLATAVFTDARYPDRPATLRNRWRRRQAEDWAAHNARKAAE